MGTNMPGVMQMGGSIDGGMVISLSDTRLCNGDAYEQVCFRVRAGALVWSGVIRVRTWTYDRACLSVGRVVVGVASVAM